MSAQKFDAMKVNRAAGYLPRPAGGVGQPPSVSSATAGGPPEASVRMGSMDAAVVAGLQRGEPWAADQLYQRTQRAVIGTLRRVLRSSGDDLEDVMQESYARIITVLSERSLGDNCNLSAWAGAVAAHVALDRLRRRARERRWFVAEGLPEQQGVDSAAIAGPERGLEARSQLVRLQATLADMRAKYAEALVLHDVLGHDLKEVAELTGVSVAAAQSRLVRGRKELVRRLRAHGGTVL